MKNRNPASDHGGGILIFHTRAYMIFHIRAYMEFHIVKKITASDSLR